MGEKKSSGGSTTVTTKTTTVVETRVETKPSEEKTTQPEKSLGEKVVKRVVIAVVTGGLLS